MMKRLFMFPVLLMGLSLAPYTERVEGAKQQVASVKGFVLCGDKEYPAADITVILIDEKKTKTRDNGMETKTDVKGDYTFESVKPGRYTLAYRFQPGSRLEVFRSGWIIAGGKKITQGMAIGCK